MHLRGASLIEAVEATVTADMGERQFEKSKIKSVHWYQLSVGEALTYLADHTGRSLEVGQKLTVRAYWTDATKTRLDRVVIGRRSGYGYSANRSFVADDGGRR